ncbi:MAG TPA: DUF2779 domain-containing protein [Syntrophorhabdales bacterium]|nr:DUF2779 domain-containing protein [Syntrophorhabdales bacterium]
MAKRKDEPAYLSKSLFIRGLQCHKSLYLDRYQPELKDEVSEEKQAIFDSGIEVGKLARDLFPGGVEVPYEGLSLQEQLDMTAAEIQKGTQTIYEAAFSYDNVFMKADILHKGKGGWELYEVKQSTEVKEVYVHDVALQYHVLEGSGLPVSKAFIVHINNQYVRRGAIKVDKLFALEDLSGRVKDKQVFVAEELGRMRNMLTRALPVIDIGAWCDDPYECDFKGHCWQHIPEDSVFTLKGKGADQFDLYRQGIIRLEQVPLHLLNAAQRMQVEFFLQKKESVNKEAVREFLDTLWYPLYFLDFETFMSPIPPFDGTRPYQQIPYQFSIHFLEHEGAELQHYEFLAAPNVDPREELTRRLVAEIPDDACVVAYNSSFEARILKELAEWLPKYASTIEKIVSNMRDLMAPFRRRDVYHWRMKGSYSQKEVLPALVPDLSYEGMEVADGGMAMQAYFTMCGAKDPSEVNRIRSSLLEYCKLDTLGMVRLLEKLREFVQR